MPDWLIIGIAVIGIVLIGVAFAFLDLVKGFARAVFAGLFVLLLILAVNRFLSPESELPPNQAFPPDQDFPQTNGDDSPIDDLSAYLRDLGESIDELVFGAEDELDQEPAPDEPSDSDSIGLGNPFGQSEGDLVYPLPENFPDPGPVSRQARQSTDRSRTQQHSGNSATPTRSHPIPGMW